MGTGAWYGHECSGQQRGPAHLWQERWCHLEHPGAEPRIDACGKCAIHCECPSRQRNNLPARGEDETLQQFAERLLRSKRDVWSQHNSE
jgi:hypothetical protein